MVKIAMWSGPRNLSTAMMYAFAARGDCAVWDEPFYAAFLERSGASHPMAAEIKERHEADPVRVAKRCAGLVPDGRDVFYMKHMPHHMLPGFPLDWAAECVNIHLIRHPARVIASYGQKRDDMTLQDIGYPQQHAIWSRIPGPVIDSTDIRADPARAMAVLCEVAGIPDTPDMLRWDAGKRPFDGVWAAHWYNAVHQSTGFAGPEGPLPQVPEARRPLLEAALPIYEAMRAEALRL